MMEHTPNMYLGNSRHGRCHAPFKMDRELSCVKISAGGMVPVREGRGCVLRKSQRWGYYASLKTEGDVSCTTVPTGGTVPETKWSGVRDAKQQARALWFPLEDGGGVAVTDRPDRSGESIQPYSNSS
jgi:hypothetical protein